VNDIFEHPNQLLQQKSMQQQRHRHRHRHQHVSK
jgi:hypothetical protein